MDETHLALDRLETRIEDQAARIDALYGLLEARGLLPRGVGTGRGDALFDDESEALDRSGGWKGRRRPAADRATRFHLGEATGV
jgi:hypothetical protein